MATLQSADLSGWPLLESGMSRLVLCQFFLNLELISLIISDLGRITTQAPQADS
jgi:hypothetical protein